MRRLSCLSTWSTWSPPQSNAFWFIPKKRLTEEAILVNLLGRLGPLLVASSVKRFLGMNQKAFDRGGYPKKSVRLRRQSWLMYLRLNLKAPGVFGIQSAFNVRSKCIQSVSGKMKGSVRVPRDRGVPGGAWKIRILAHFGAQGFGKLEF